MKHISHIYHTLWMCCLLSYTVFAQGQTVSDKKSDDEARSDLIYPLKDRQTVIDESSTPFYFKDPSSIQRTVKYDAKTNKYIIEEKIGGKSYRPPVYMTYDEYMEYTLKESQKKYWKDKESAIGLVEKKGLIKPIQIKSTKFERIFGKGGIDIKPQGNVELTIGGNSQRIFNPAIPPRQQRSGALDFDMNFDVNVTGKIGERILVNIKQSNLNSFNFANQFKLKYQGLEDEIIRSVDVGNVSLDLPTQLITGNQRLFGMKAELQFGRMTIKTVASQQNSKKQSVTIQGGGVQQQNFTINADQYDANRHFLLAQYFRDTYEQSLSTYPIVSSQVEIDEIEVWITNRTNATAGARDVVAFMDLAENKPFSSQINPIGTSPLPSNNNNNLYGRLNANQANREVANITQLLESSAFNLSPISDYEKTYARRLNTSEYTVNRKLGYISLNTSLQPNEVLAVAYQYTLNGEVFKVGDFARDVVPPDTNSTNNVLFLKMLKSTAEIPTLPIWNLMMKNVYSLQTFNVSPTNFMLDVYYDNPGEGNQRYLPTPNLQGNPLIRVLGLDRLNDNQDPQPNGVFDFISGVTITPQNGRIFFPVLEPFGDGLRQLLSDAGDANFAPKLVYDELYDSTLFIAQQSPEFNRFSIRGHYQGNSSKNIFLGAFNVPQGSVTVSLGSQRLVEGIDYTVNYNLGRVTIINEGLLNSSAPINIQFENDLIFGNQRQNFFGLRLDYRVNDRFNVGGSILNLREQPFSNKVNIGFEPINNSIFGLDLKYGVDLPGLTRGLNKLPFYSTKETSSIDVVAEGAYLKPGHSRQIGREGIVFVDDFEGTTSGVALGQPASVWHLASTPRGATDAAGQVLFPEASRINDLTYGFNRAKLAWYNIQPLLVIPGLSTPDYLEDNPSLRLDHYVRRIDQKEIFPNRDLGNDIFTNLTTFDLAYYPTERGAYNFESSNSPTPNVSRGINTDGTLKSPETRWGGIQRSIQSTNFESSNIEYIEFWMLDPFINNPNHSGGELYFNLGNISEDILKDSRLAYENGLDQQGVLGNQVDSTFWGQVSRLTPLTNNFDNNPALRTLQDVGFDGLSNELERQRFDAFLNQIRASISPEAFSTIQADPSSDDFVSYLDNTLISQQPSILDLYKNFNGTEGNSPVATSNDIPVGSTNRPNTEDLNRDNTLSESESYFQYRVPLNPSMDVENHPYIVSKIEHPASTVEGVNLPPYTWFQFRIPIRSFDARIGSIADFRSIQFVRMFLTSFQQDVVLRMAEMELVRNQWRTYNQLLLDAQEEIQTDELVETSFVVASVDIENNANKEPVNYVLPPGVVREQFEGAQRVLALQNEQSLSLSVCALKDGDARAVYQEINQDFRRYERLKMFVHAESIPGQEAVENNELTAFIRIGKDFTDNYYELEIPLQITPDGRYTDSPTDRLIVWPVKNELDIELKRFVALKRERNNKNIAFDIPYTIIENEKLLTIVGNPDIGLVKNIMLGIRNPGAFDVDNTPIVNDREAKCVEVWMNELRLVGLNNRGGGAALASVNLKLADLARVGLSANYHSIGFGQLHQKIDERYRNELVNYDFTTTWALGKLFPAKAGLQIPFYGNISQSFSTPEFDPYQLDISVKERVQDIRTAGGAVSNYRQSVQDRISVMGFNFTDVRRLRLNAKRPVRFYDIENFSFSYAHNVRQESNPFIYFDKLTTQIGTIRYNVAPKTIYLQPFKKAIKSKSKYLRIFKDFGINFFPSKMGVSTTLHRQFGELKLRRLNTENIDIATTYNKFFNWSRDYNISYSPIRALTVSFTAHNDSRIDEPDGKIDTREERQQVWQEIRHGGRTLFYDQQITANFKLPLSKIPILDWMSARANYTGRFSWTASPQEIDNEGNRIDNSIGNIATNGQQVRGSLDLNFKKLYDKVPFLKTYNSSRGGLGNKQTTQKKKENIIGQRVALKKRIEKQGERKQELMAKIRVLRTDEAQDKKERKQAKKDLKKQLRSAKRKLKRLKKQYRQKQLPAQPYKSIFIQPLLMLKKVSVSYTEDRSTILPGYVGRTRFIGIDKVLKSPGYDFVFGAQPGMPLFAPPDPAARNRWLQEGAQKGWFTRDTLLNYQFRQTYKKNWSVRATLEPWRDIKIELNSEQSFTENHTQIFKVVEEGGAFEHLTPQTFGSFTSTFVGVTTIFDKLTDEGLTETFQQFDQNRIVISRRLGNENPFSEGNFFNPKDSASNANYRDGYGPVSQEVLIASFLAAYQGRSAERVSLNPQGLIPLPNWRLTYSGLTKYAWARKAFKTFSITHGYKGTYTINSFRTNLNYEGSNNPFASQIIDSTTGNFITRFIIPDVVIRESFSPLVGVNFTTINNITCRLNYAKSRTLNLSFQDYQMLENRQESVSLGLGYKIRGLKLPFKIKGKKIVLKNDLSFAFDFAFRDNNVIIHRIDQGLSEFTSGNRSFTYSPRINYTVSNTLSVELFYNHTYTVPRLSNSFPIRTNNGGVKVRLSIAP